MIKKKLEIFRKKLLEMKKEILATILEEINGDETSLNIDGDLADKAEAISEVSVLEGVTSSQKNTFDKIQKALQTIKEGTFGKCVVCEKAIEEDRLEAIPYADKCKQHMNNR